MWHQTGTGRGTADSASDTGADPVPDLSPTDAADDEPADSGELETRLDAVDGRDVDVAAPECRPGEPPRFCGRMTGACERGLIICQGDGTWSDCVEAPAVWECSDGAACVAGETCADGAACGFRSCDDAGDCGPDGVCVAEDLQAREDLSDDCTDDADPGCLRSICRYPAPGPSCETVDDCGGVECDDLGCACVDGACHAGVAGPISHELCNGIDDDCDGLIDDDEWGSGVCSPCPFGTSLTFITRPDGGSDFACVMDYEASRSDATAEFAGALGLYVTSRAGVLPLTGLSPEMAEALCRGAAFDELDDVPAPAPPMRLCRDYERGACADVRPGDCNDATIGLGLQPTGSFSACPGDLSGNAAEIVSGEGGFLVVGGSYLDEDLSCDRLPAPRLVAPDEMLGPDVGFRCCTERR